jgi:hypothetical protein
LTFEYLPAPVMRRRPARSIAFVFRSTASVLRESRSVAHMEGKEK